MIKYLLCTSDGKIKATPSKLSFVFWVLRKRKRDLQFTQISTAHHRLTNVHTHNKSHIEIGTFISCKVYYCDCIDITLTLEAFTSPFILFFGLCNGTHETRIKEPNVLLFGRSLNFRLWSEGISNTVHQMIFNVFSMFVPRFWIQITFFNAAYIGRTITKITTTTMEKKKRRKTIYIQHSMQIANEGGEQWGVKCTEWNKTESMRVRTMHFGYPNTNTYSLSQEVNDGKSRFLDAKIPHSFFFAPFFWHIKFEKLKRDYDVLVRACNANALVKIKINDQRMNDRVRERVKKNQAIYPYRGPHTDSNLMPVSRMNERAQMMMMVIWFVENTALITHAINICLSNISHIFFSLFSSSTESIRWKTANTFSTEPKLFLPFSHILSLCFPIFGAGSFFERNKKTRIDEYKFTWWHPLIRIWCSRIYIFFTLSN